MEKASKSLVVRFPELLHREIKLQAYREGKTIQEWVFAALQQKLNASKIQNTWLCQECGQWDLLGTQMALIRDCEKCHQNKATFPVMEKK